MDFFNYISTNEFFIFGTLVFYFIIPIIVLIIHFFINFLFDYSEFRSYKKENSLKQNYEQKKFELLALEKELKLIEKD